MRKMRFDIDYDYNFSLFGISCHTKDYRLCWIINKKLNISLKRGQDIAISIQSKQKKLTVKENQFSHYQYNDVDNHLKYHIIANKDKFGYFIAEHKQSDFFLIIKGDLEKKNKKKKINILKKADIILTIYEIDISQLKSKERLVFE